ncbi:hypothetical protein VTN02DRAFT_1383 [Thermoascus thermophilus]
MRGRDGVEHVSREEGEPSARGGHTAIELVQTERAQLTQRGHHPGGDGLHDQHASVSRPLEKVQLGRRADEHELLQPWQPAQRLAGHVGAGHGEAGEVEGAQVPMEGGGEEKGQRDLVVVQGQALQQRQVMMVMTIPPDDEGEDRSEDPLVRLGVPIGLLQHHQVP